MHCGSSQCRREQCRPDERTMAIVFLPDRPKAFGETLAYLFRDTCMPGNKAADFQIQETYPQVGMLTTAKHGGSHCAHVLYMDSNPADLRCHVYESQITNESHAESRQTSLVLPS